MHNQRALASDIVDQCILWALYCLRYIYINSINRVRHVRFILYQQRLQRNISQNIKDASNKLKDITEDKMDLNYKKYDFT